MSEYWRVLVRKGRYCDSDDHADGRHVHAVLQVLRNEDEQSSGSSGRECREVCGT